MPLDTSDNARLSGGVVLHPQGKCCRLGLLVILSCAVNSLTIWGHAVEDLVGGLGPQVRAVFSGYEDQPYVGSLRR